MAYRIDHFRIDGFETVGSRLRVDGYFSRTGVQSYAQGDGTIRREQRDASEVFSDESLSSMRAMPVSIGHPPRKMFDAKNWKKLNPIGHVGDEVAPAPDGIHTTGSVWIMDHSAQQKIIDGKLVEFSVGYFADLEEQPGTNDAGEHYDARQTKIQGNHLAILGEGQARGGRECRIRLDSNGDATVEPNEPDQPRKREDLMKLKIKADGYDHEVEAPTDGLAVALEKERAESAARIDALKNENEQLKAKHDSEKERADDLDAKLSDATDPEKIQAELERAAKIRADAERLAGKKMDCPVADLKPEALKAIGVDLADKSEAYIDARFDTELDRAKKTPLADVRQPPKTPERSDEDDTSLDLNDILNERLSRKAD